MKRLRRWLFNILSAISLLVAAATAIVWIRSYWIQDSLLWTHGSDQPYISLETREAVCGRGGLQFSHDYWEWRRDFQGFVPTSHHFQHTSSRSPIYPYFINLHIQKPPTTDIRFKGFEFAYLNYRDPFMMGGYPIETVREQSVTFPLAAIFFPAIFLSVLWKRREIKQRRRLTKGLCTNCGYDLRATPDRCPECGTVPTKQNAISN
jgi:hypothetical protein